VGAGGEPPKGLGERTRRGRLRCFRGGTCISMEDDIPDDSPPHVVAQAASSFAAVFLAEVDERCRALEARLDERLVGEVMERVRHDLDERLLSLSAEVQAVWEASRSGLASLNAEVHAGWEARDLHLEKSCSTLQEAIDGLEDRVASHSGRVGAVEEGLRTKDGLEAALSSGASRAVHEGLERADSERADLRLQLRALESVCSTMQGRSEAELDRRAEDTRRQLDGLRQLSDSSMQALQQRLVEVAEAFSKAELNGPKAAEADRVCVNHMAVAREALTVIKASHEDLRSKVDAIEQNQNVGSSAPSRATLDGDDLQEQLQAFREQLLNLSMRVSELAMGSDHQALQTLSEECRTELERHMQAVKRTEQAMDHNVMSGRAALEQLGQKQARLEQRLTGTQQMLQAELGELLEELHRLRIPVDTQRFQSVSGGGGPRGGRPNSAADGAGNGPPSRAGVPMVDGRSPVDIRGGGEPLGASFKGPAPLSQGGRTPQGSSSAPVVLGGSPSSTGGQGTGGGSQKPVDDACVVT